MKKRLGINSIVTEKNGQWWETFTFMSTQNINFITQFFPEILQNHSYFEYFRHVRSHPSKHNSISLLKTVILVAQKISFIPTFFLKIMLRLSKLVVLSNLGRSGHAHQD